MTTACSVGGRVLEEGPGRELAKPGKKTTAGLLAAHETKTEVPIIEVEPEPRKPVDHRALWLWGRLLDFEREGILSADPAELIEARLDHMKA
jgi:hypothetical protein